MGTPRFARSSLAWYSDNRLGTDHNANNGGVIAQNYHVWNGSGALEGYTLTAATSGTFEIARVGSTVSGYFDGNLIDSETETGALTSIGFVLQNFSGNDAIQATYTNFSVSAAAVPEPTGLVLLGLGMVGVAGLGWQRWLRARC